MGGADKFSGIPRVAPKHRTTAIPKIGQSVEVCVLLERRVGNQVLRQKSGCGGRQHLDAGDAARHGTEGVGDHNRVTTLMRDLGI